MPCNLYNCGDFACGGCCHFRRSTAVTLTGTQLIITIPEDTFSNGEKVCIGIAQSLPTNVTSADTVVIQIGDATTYQSIITKCGNNVRGDQIRQGKVYHLYAATDNNLFVVNACELCKTSFNYPIMPTTASSATTE